MVADSPPPCFQDRWGVWQCGHKHDELDSVSLEDTYRYVAGWTAQELAANLETGPRAPIA
jgi:hypothetical protein